MPPRWRIGVAAAALFAAVAVADSMSVTFPRSSLSVVTDQGSFPFTAEVASTPRQQARGLMERREVPADHAMLFVFAPPRPVSFWMKNTLVPLDMLFVAGGRVAAIHRAAVPGSLEPIPSPGPACAVIEVVAGTADRLSVHVGDRVASPDLAACEPASAGDGAPAQSSSPAPQ